MRRSFAHFDFHAVGSTATQLRRLKKSGNDSRLQIGMVAWAATALAAVYIIIHPPVIVDPGQVNLASALSPSDTTTASVIPVTGFVRDSRRKEIILDVNGRQRTVTVSEGAFATNVPLVPGENAIQAVSDNVASPVLKVTATIPNSEIWIELSWSGPGDVDLHLRLPDGQECWYSNMKVDGAVLDVDNQVRDGPEHITMEKAMPGTYQVSVVYYSARDRDPHLPVAWTVLIRLEDGRVQRTYEGRLVSVKERQILGPREGEVIASNQLATDNVVSTFTFPQSQ